MTVRWMEGFETVEGANPTRKYEAASASLAFASGRFFGSAGKTTGSDVTFRTRDLIGASGVTQGIVGLAFNTTDAVTGTTPVVDVWGVSASQLQFKLRTTTGNHYVDVYRGATLLGSTTAIPVAAGWVYLEFYFKIHNTAGDVTILADGVGKLTLSSVNTADAFGSEGNQWRKLQFALVGGVGGIDDIYALTLDGTVNNNFLGSRVVEGVRPTSDGSETDWTPTPAGPHHANINEAVGDDSANYVEGSIGGGARDLYGMGQLANCGEEVNAVMLQYRAALNAGGTRDYYPRYKSQLDEGNATTPGTITSTVYSNQLFIQEEEPGVASPRPWSKTIFNEGEFGLEDD